MITLKEIADRLCRRLPSRLIDRAEAEAEVSALHDVLCDISKGLRATWSRHPADGHSLGVFYDVGPTRTKGLTPIQYDELVRLARVGLEAEEGGKH